MSNMNESENELVGQLKASLGMEAPSMNSWQGALHSELTHTIVGAAINFNVPVLWRGVKRLIR